MVDALRQGWVAAGLCAGDTLLLHSDIRRTMVEHRRHKLTPRDILDSVLDVLGTGGTLVLPLFNFGFPRGEPFDIRHTPSHMGALTEAGRLHPAAVRTGHPIYSFAAIGHHAPLFAGVDNVSGYAEDSPFGMLRRLDAKIGALDLDDQACMTYYHHVEELRRVDYRYFKSFSGDCTDALGQTTRKTYQLYVRDLDRGVTTAVNPAGEQMWRAGLVQGFRPGQGPGLRLVRARAMFDFVADIIDRGQALGTLYTTGT